MVRLTPFATVLTLMACSSVPRPVTAPAEVSLGFRLDPEEDPAHALAVASRRLVALGVHGADLTAVQGFLSLRVPAREVREVGSVLRTTPWLRVRPVDDRLDLTLLLPGALPSGVRAESEPLVLAAGLTMRATVIVAEPGARDALASLMAAMRVPSRVLVIVPRGDGWQLLAVEDRTALHGGLVSRCVASGPASVTLVFGEAAASAREALGHNGIARRGVFEIDGVPRAVGDLARDPTVVFEQPAEAVELVTQCAAGMLRGAMVSEP